MHQYQQRAQKWPVMYFKPQKFAHHLCFLDLGKSKFWSNKHAIFRQLRHVSQWVGQLLLLFNLYHCYITSCFHRLIMYYSIADVKDILPTYRLTVREWPSPEPAGWCRRQPPWPWLCQTATILHYKNAFHRSEIDTTTELYWSRCTRITIWMHFQ